jgi:large subunit ribosomal protein L31
MKSNIHPTWYNEAVVTCACGNTFTTGSTVEAIQVDICSKCHPFFTGEMRFVDRQGRVDKFMQKMQKAESLKAKQGPATRKSAKNTDKIETDPKSYQEILRDQQSALRKSAKSDVKVDPAQPAK